MASDSYLQLLRDPRWQRRRLEIMQRDSWSCTSCGATDRTLNVHHRRYVSGAKPWEYDATDLVTLCEDCHKTVTQAADLIKRSVATLNADHLSWFSGFAVGEAYRSGGLRGTHVFGGNLMCRGFSYATGKDLDEVNARVVNGMLDLDELFKADDAADEIVLAEMRAERESGGKS